MCLAEHLRSAKTQLEVKRREKERERERALRFTLISSKNLQVKHFNHEIKTLEKTRFIILSAANYKISLDSV